jgi:hypothetical protein
MTSNRNQYTNDVANAEDNEFPNPLLENYGPQSRLPQNGPGHHVESEPSRKIPECWNYPGPNPAVELNLNEYTNAAPQPHMIHTTKSDTTGYGFQMSVSGPANAVTTQGDMPALPDEFEGYFGSGTGGWWDEPIGRELLSPPRFLTAMRVDAWTTAQEEYLMASKKRGKTFPEIRVGMWTAFGVDKNPNVLSKRYRAIIERNAKENVRLQNLVKSATNCGVANVQVLGDCAVFEWGAAEHLAVF